MTPVVQMRGLPRARRGLPSAPPSALVAPACFRCFLWQRYPREGARGSRYLQLFWRSLPRPWSQPKSGKEAKRRRLQRESSITTQRAGLRNSTCQTHRSFDNGGSMAKQAWLPAIFTLVSPRSLLPVRFAAAEPAGSEVMSEVEPGRGDESLSR